MLEPIRENEGANIIGPRNPDREAQNPDVICPPATDSGTLPNMKWSFADSHIRIEDGGWARQTTVRELPTSVELAGVNMRLEEGVYRELHWHQEAEWAYILEGTCRITVLDVEGGIFTDDLTKGDLWYFPTGNPHSLQGIGKGGCEFLLIFDDGNFSEDSTFLLTDWLAHTSKDVLSKNFQVPISTFDALSKKDPPLKNSSKRVFTHRLLKQPPQKFPGGEIRIADTTNFGISKTVAAAHVLLDGGAMREMHWHPMADEWSYFIRGRARVTIFASSGTARSFNYVAGDVGIVPRNHGHYVENLGSEPLEFLEIFRAEKFEDFSLGQWLGQSEAPMVVDHLNLEGRARVAFMDALSKEKLPVRTAMAKL